MRQGDDRYLVAIATYQRPNQLERLLDSLVLSIDGQNVEILVVDNDPHATAQSVVASHPLRPRYMVEADPGIPSARNRALDAFTEDFAGILFVDDDEWVGEDWFETLTRYAKQTGAGAVMGTVMTVLPEAAPRWMRHGGVYQRAIWASGTSLAAAATNNSLLMRPAWLAAGSPRFDNAFATTGGSDTDLFTTIHRAGATIIVCAEAVVFEEMPESRLSWSWLWRRYTRHGITDVLVRKKRGDPLARLMLRAVARLQVGIAQLVFDTVRGRGIKQAPLLGICHSFGVLAGAVGYRLHPYSRTDA